MTFATGRVNFRAFPFYKNHRTVISQYTLMHRLTYEQISVLLPQWEMKYCLWWTHTCFIFHPSVPLEFLECFSPPACSQNTDGIHCHAQTGSYRNEWWIGHSSAETFAQDASLRLYCFFNCRFSCWWHLASLLTVFSASCTVFKILRQVKNRASVTSEKQSEETGGGKFDDIPHSW